MLHHFQLVRDQVLLAKMFTNLAKHSLVPNGRLNRLSNFKSESGVYAMRSLKGHSSVILWVSGVLSAHTRPGMCVIELWQTRRTHNLACKNLCTPIFASYCDCDGFWNFFLPFFPIFCGASSCIVFDPGDHFFFCSTNYSVYRLTGNWSNFLKNLNFLAMQDFKFNNIFLKKF